MLYIKVIGFFEKNCSRILLREIFLYFVNVLNMNLVFVVDLFGFRIGKWGRY